MRVFIAIDLPPEIKEELKKAQKELKGAKLSITKDFHITLKFLGEITPDKVSIVGEKLRNISFKPFKTGLSTIGVFPDSSEILWISERDQNVRHSDKSKIRVIWVGVSPEEEIKALQDEIDHALKEYFTKEKDFKSHITIARVKFIENKKELMDSINKIRMNKLKFQINDFKLKKSTLAREGPVYEDIEVFKHELQKL